MTVHELATMGSSGDSKIMWDSEVPAEVTNARRTFDDLTGRGYAAFAVRKSGDKGERVHQFDADAERLILVPPLAGG